MRKIKCYEESCNGLEVVIAGYVTYTRNLDHWDGHNMVARGCSIGRDEYSHEGLGKTKDGKYYLCHSSQWQGSEDYAEIISETEAKQRAFQDADVYKEFFGEMPALD